MPDRPVAGPAPIEVQREAYDRQKAAAKAYDLDNLYAPKPSSEPVTKGTEMARGILAVVKGAAGRKQVVETAIETGTDDNVRLQQNQSTDSNN